mgnify:CR=1 FL=1
MLAICLAKRAAVKRLIKRGADVNASSKARASPRSLVLPACIVVRICSMLKFPVTHAEPQHRAPFQLRLPLPSSPLFSVQIFSPTRQPTMSEDVTQPHAYRLLHAVW